ncbi:MAG: hypothetical protein R2942_12805 [Ignavibacteria bacterium]
MNKNKFYTKLTLRNILFQYSAFYYCFQLFGSWKRGMTQQFMPYLNNRPLADITFLDSLTVRGDW